MMPRVIQPGGGIGKMRVRYTLYRAQEAWPSALKRMQAEVMTLGELCVTTPPPPAEKLIQNPHRKTKAPRHPPVVSAQTPSSYI